MTAQSVGSRVSLGAVLVMTRVDFHITIWKSEGQSF